MIIEIILIANIYWALLQVVTFLNTSHILFFIVKLGSYYIVVYAFFFHFSDTLFWIKGHEHDSCYMLPSFLPEELYQMVLPQAMYESAVLLCFLIIEHYLVVFFLIWFGEKSIFVYLKIVSLDMFFIYIGGTWISWKIYYLCG